MAVKERHIGALYIDGKKVADKCEEIVETVELDKDFRDRALNFPEKLTVTFSDFRLKRNEVQIRGKEKYLILYCIAL